MDQKFYVKLAIFCENRKDEIFLSHQYFGEMRGFYENLETLQRMAEDKMNKTTFKKYYKWWCKKNEEVAEQFRLGL